MKDSSAQGTLGPHRQGTGSDGATHGSLSHAQSASYSCLRARARLLIQAGFSWRGSPERSEARAGVTTAAQVTHVPQGGATNPSLPSVSGGGRRDPAFTLRCAFLRTRRSQPALTHSAHPFTGMRHSHEKMGRGWVILFSIH